jgi:hypothetical protein
MFSTLLEVTLAGKNDGPCTLDGCEIQAHANKLCKKHDARRARELASPKQRGVAARRRHQCQADGCTNWHPLGDKSNGRKWSGRWYCREHEVIALQHPNNLERMAKGIHPQNECWVYRLSWASEGTEDEDLFPSTSAPYAKFYPAGTGSGINKYGKKYDAAWVAHRALWSMLMGPIGMNRELDHLDDCTAKTLCCNPAHLEPVTKFVHTNRGTARRAVANGRQTRTVRECGPRFNKDAALNQAVIDFAQEHRLSLPAV